MADYSYKKIALGFLILGLVLVIFPPIIRTVIGVREVILYLRITGTIMVAMSAGAIFARRKGVKDKIPPWLLFILATLIGSLFLANTIIREVGNAMRGNGIYQNITSQTEQK